MYCILRIKNNISDVIFIDNINKVLKYSKLAIESSNSEGILELHGTRYNHKSSWKINLLEYKNKTFTCKRNNYTVNLKDDINIETSVNKIPTYWDRFYLKFICCK